MEQAHYTIRHPVSSREAGLRGDPPAALTYSRQDLVGAVCLSIIGELDLASISSFRTHVRSAAEPTHNLILDVRALRSIDPSGIHALLDAYQTFTLAGRRMALVAVSPRIQRVFAAFGIDEVLPVFSTVSAALADFNDGSRAK